MYYYILDGSRKIRNSIVLSDDANPSDFGAVADERQFSIGDTWTQPDPQPSEIDLLRQQLRDLQNQIVALRGDSR